MSRSVVGKLFRWAGFAGAAFAVLVLVALGVVWIAFPRVAPPQDLEIEPTVARVERGRYLVQHVANCLNCHSERDWSRYGGPLVAGTEGKGAPLSVLRPSVWSANITPYALDVYSDGELVRAITSGINQQGRPLHPFMPYDSYARMSEEDVHAVVAYLRTLSPIEFLTPIPDESWPIRLIGRILPRPWEPSPSPDFENSVERGRYLAAIAECSFCHGSDYSGGQSFRIPEGAEVVSMNLTPSPSTRIGNWSRDNFIGVFQSFADEAVRLAPVPPDSPNTVMPWHTYSGMTSRDLGAIYDYLRTIPPAE